MAARKRFAWYAWFVLAFSLAVIVWGKDVQPAEIPPSLRGSVHLPDMVVYPVYRLALAGVGLGHGRDDGGEVSWRFHRNADRQWRWERIPAAEGVTRQSSSGFAR